MAKFQPWEYAGDGCVRVVGGATKNPKKITGTRLGAVVGLDSWKTPFGAWCEIARVAEEPFEGNKYTDAGNAIEPKLLEFCKVEVSPYIITPEEFYGVKDVKKHTGYDFFAPHPVFGGMWDALIGDGNGSHLGVVEAKTSSRPQDWEHGVPEKYAVQALTYAVLFGVERAYVPVAFLEDEDYAKPEEFVCTDDNTFVYELHVDAWRDSEGNNIHQIMDTAEDFWTACVTGNHSPTFDEKRDKKYLDIMRRNEVKSDGLEALATQAATLEARIEVIREESGLNELEKQLKALKDKQLKPELIKLFGKNDEVVSAYGWKVKLSQTETIDKEALATDKLLEKYTVLKPKYTMTKEK